ncbi:MAG: DUF3501 family protein [Alphaproteobacteria bacterium]|jgi:hypothetical protein|nr:DUF3501 family protein [Alphaproteobacteria bacterium]
MSREQRIIAHDDIMDMTAYGAIRSQKRTELRPEKKLRQVSVGPFCTFYFESYDTMWHQVHEMLFVERGGEEQIEDELRAYNPLIPQGNELVATVMFEVTDVERRVDILRTLGGVDERLYLSVGGTKLYATINEDDIERTTADGKTSSVHFIRFVMSEDMAEQFKDNQIEVFLGCDHPNYGHMAIIPAESRSVLVKDL